MLSERLSEPLSLKASCSEPSQQANLVQSVYVKAELTPLVTWAWRTTLSRRSRQDFLNLLD